MTVTVDTQFTGTDGAAWPSPWTITAGSASIQNNHGRLAKGAAAWSGGQARTGVTEDRVLFAGRMLVASTAQSSYQTAIVRRVDDGNYFSAELFPPSGLWELKTWQAYTDTLLGSHTLAGLSNGTVVNFELEADGTTVRLRTWRQVDAKPAGWQITATGRSEHPSGDVAVAINSGDAVAHYMDLDFLTVDNLEADPDPPPPGGDPSSLSVTMVDQTATLSWSSPSMAGADAVDVFRRGPGGLTGVAFDPDVATPVGRVPVGQTTYQDSGLPVGDYEWQVFPVITG